jgi:hypothetical protein
MTASNKTMRGQRRGRFGGCTGVASGNEAEFMRGLAPIGYRELVTSTSFTAV